MFPDRVDAGKKIAEKLREYAGKNAVVLGLPRGGVVVAHEVAEALKLPLDIVAVRKVGHPNNSEYAVGAVDAEGGTIMDEAETATIDREWLAREIAREREEAIRRTHVYRGEKEPLRLSGKIVIVVDDGIATGLTMRVALRRARAEGATGTIVAVPVAPQDSLDTLAREGADVVVLIPPEQFLSAVGAHYQHFEQVSDEEVVRLMH